ncbi:MAG: TrkA family potassium uptake protein [Candidatus Margulisbacteria bacterium]|nr:TrkA family potassium uptake protein [Candidatus Margulisiibacteriota bacterium]MBU1617336.1 TrkA family potassium uptake protein [Candidatus Margulisiibacteriota bacterium]
MKKRQFAVLGLGRFGSKVARELFYKGQEVIAIDKDEVKIQNIKDEVTHAYVGDITDEGALKEAGVADCDTVVVAESTHMESNIIATQICKSLKIPQVICKANNTIHGQILQKLGADQIIFPEQDTAIKLINVLTSQGVLDYFDLGEKVKIVGTKALPQWAGKGLSELDLRNKYAITVLAIRRGKESLLIPSWSTPIQKEDVLILFGEEESLKKLDMDISHKT